MSSAKNNQKLVEKIQKLKKQRKAIILVHNYQLPEVQDIADHLGDSLGLSRIASQTDAEVIVFCGVHFMAETASILSPDKTVLLPDKKAGCPMVDMINRNQLIELKNKHPQATTVGYVNSCAEVKAELDVCCTSANAVKVINSLKDKETIIFVPDKYLGSYAASQANRGIIIWKGYCATHLKIKPEDIVKVKEKHPEAKVLIHPECTPEAIKLADAVLSTSGMCKYAQESDAKEFIIGTETGLIYRLEQDNPEKKFYAASKKTICPNMKLTTLEKVLWSLEDMKYEVKVPDEIRLRARKAVNKMLKIA